MDVAAGKLLRKGTPAEVLKSFEGAAVALGGQLRKATVYHDQPTGDGSDPVSRSNKLLRE